MADASAEVRPGAAPAPGGCWPTDDQLLLLRAGLFAREEARDAWARWSSVHSLEHADHVSVRLFPLVYRNLGSEGLDEPSLGVLKGVYRATWARNQVLLEGTAGALRALAGAGIPTMVLKGVALALGHYRDAGVRPMKDVDVLVPWGNADRALAVLTGAGWTAEARGVSGGRLRSAHAQSLWDPNGRMLDLHWYSLAQSGSDERFWSSSVDLEVLGTPTRTLCPTDQLLHVVAHGGQWGDLPPIRWMADAVAIERSSGSALDWERLVFDATSRRMTVLLSAGLEHLAADLRFPVPPWVLEALERAPKGRFERRLHRAVLRPSGGGSRVLVEVERFRRRSRLDPSLRLADFLKDHFGVSTRRGLAVRIVRKAAQVALLQTAGRLLPRHLGACPRCGRTIATWRPTAAVRCRSCSS